MKRADKKPADKKAAVKWAKKPSARPQAPAPLDADSFVLGAKEPMIRLNLNIPRSFHAHVKAQCALKGRNMTDAIMELLEQHFPRDKGV